MKTDVNDFLPLSPATLHILIALADEDRHGYGIMQEVAKHSEGQFKLGPGTLYDNLEKLLDQKVVEETAQPKAEQDSRRRYYRLTTLGRSILRAEIARLKDLIRAASPHIRMPKPRST